LTSRGACVCCQEITPVRPDLEAGINKTEAAGVRIFLGIACPLLTCVLFWWTAAVASLYVLHVPERLIATAALAGLAIGALLDIVFLKRWARRFYSANVWFLVALYVALSAVAVAFCMGLPLGTFALGIGAGLYAGRRARHLGLDEARGRTLVRKGALLAASVTTAAALPMGILALREDSVIGLLGAVTHLDDPTFRGVSGAGLVGALVLLLFLAQHWCSRRVGRAALTISTSEALPSA
jgi:hypothetical protein